MLTRQVIRPLAIVLAILGAVLLVLGIIYLTTKASSLPTWIPGHVARRVTKKGRVLGSKAHVKRGLAVIAVGIAVFAGTWWLAFRYEPADA